MPAPTLEERDKILKGMGAGPAMAPYETDASLDEAEDNENAEAEAAGEEEEIIAQSGSTDEGEESEAVEESPEELLARVTESFKPKASQSEEDRLRAELAETRKALEDRIAAAEAGIVGRAKEASEPEPVKYSSVEWGKVLEEAGLEPEVARSVAPMFKGLASQMESSYQGKFDDLKKRLEGFDTLRASADKKAQIESNLKVGLAHAYEQGELEKAIVEQFARDRDQSSLLAMELLKDPTAVLTPAGVAKTVQSLARSVEIKGQVSSDSSSERPSSSKTTTTSARGKGNTSPKGKKEPSPEEIIKKSIWESKPKLHNLPEFMR